VPFLAAAFAAPLAELLRSMIHEPCEFTASKRQHVLQRIAANAAARIADTFATQRTISGRLMTRRQIHQKLQTITKVVLSPRASISNADGADSSQDDAEGVVRTPGVSNAGTVCSSRVHERVSEGGVSVTRQMSMSFGGAAGNAAAAAAAAAPAELPTSARPSDAGAASDLEAEEDSSNNARKLCNHRASPSPSPAAAAAVAAADLLKRCMTADTDQAVAGSELTPCSPFSPFSLHEPMSPQAAAAAAGCCELPDQQPELKLWLEEDDVVADIGCELKYVAQLELAGSKIKRHVPLAVLARQHKQLLWLQFFLESSYTATFYTFTG
jgi:hypothetical protein